MEALRTPGSRGQVVVGVVLALVGFAAVVQVQANDRNDAFAGVRQTDLIALIDTLTLETERARGDIAELQRTRDALQDESAATGTALALARSQLQTLGILAGTVPTVGPGVRVTAEAPRAGAGGVGTDQLLNGLQELRDAGAEALEINDQVRVVAQTGIADSPAGLVVDGVQLRPPYRIDAIGNSATLSAAVDFQGGFADSVAQVGGTLTVEELDRVQVAAVRETLPLRFAEPVAPGEQGSLQ